jgi:anti-sigma factor RsiW
MVTAGTTRREHQETSMNDTDHTPPVRQDPARPTLFGLGRRSAAAVTAVGLMTGGLLGGYVVSHAATASTSPATPAAGGSTSTGTTAPSGTFHPNEDPTHEAGESAAREAQENSGQMPAPPANGTPGG